MEEKRCFKCMKFGHIRTYHATNVTANTTPLSVHLREKIKIKLASNYINNKGDQAANSSKLILVSVSKNNPVLLQTARANVSSTDEKNAKNSRLLFDTGSQLTYISPKARSELNLATVGKERLL